jgi:hypothetical protein
MRGSLNMSFLKLKYVIQFIVCASDLLVLLAFIVLCLNIKTGSVEGVLLFAVLTYYAYKSVGGLSHWKKETRQKFYDNYDKLTGCK